MEIISSYHKVADAYKVTFGQILNFNVGKFNFQFQHPDFSDAIPTLFSLRPQQGKSLFPPQSCFNFALIDSDRAATSGLRPLSDRTPTAAKVRTPTTIKAAAVRETTIQCPPLLLIDLPFHHLGGLTLLLTPLLACEQGGGERGEGRERRG